MSWLPTLFFFDTCLFLKTTKIWYQQVIGRNFCSRAFLSCAVPTEQGRRTTLAPQKPQARTDPYPLPALQWAVVMEHSNCKSAATLELERMDFATSYLCALLETAVAKLSVVEVTAFPSSYRSHPHNSRLGLLNVCRSTGRDE